MKPKREPKKGDRCEHATREGDSIRLHRDCNVRHLEGFPPGLLVPRIVDNKTALLCTGHCRLYEAPNVRKQKPRKVDAEQVDLVAAAGFERITIDDPIPSPELEARRRDHYAAMPEGI